MSVLENVTQMADRFQALEKQKHFTKDEEIRLLRERCERQEKKSKELEQAYATDTKDLEHALMCQAESYEVQLHEREQIIAELRKREKKTSLTHDILANKNDNLLKELEKETEGRNTLASEMNHLRENFTREQAAFDGKLEDIRTSMVNIVAREKELREEKDILKGKNETLEKEKRDLIQGLNEFTTQYYGLKQEFQHNKAVWQWETTQMRNDFETMGKEKAEMYAAELAEVQAKYNAIVQELKEEKAELITKNTVAQAALIEKVESISLAVPQMMQDLVSNLSKQATDFKDGCASLTANIKESPPEEIGESKA
jgi:hypothetical protein